MKKSGFLRNAVILAAFAWFYEKFILPNRQIVHDPMLHEALRFVLYGGVAWGILTLLAQRTQSGNRHKENRDDDQYPHQ